MSQIRTLMKKIERLTEIMSPIGTLMKNIGTNWAAPRNNEPDWDIDEKHWAAPRNNEPDWNIDEKHWAAHRNNEPDWDIYDETNMYNFCWLCGEKLTGMDQYSHFRANST